MATYKALIPWRCDTSEMIQEWVSAMSLGMDAVGFQKHELASVPDLEDFDFSAVVIANNTSRLIGYEIRKLVSEGLPTMYFRVGYYVARWTHTGGTDRQIPFVTIRPSTDVTPSGELTVPPNTYSTLTGPGYTTTSYNPSLFPKKMFMSSDGKNYFTMGIDPGLLSANTVTERSGAFCAASIVLERTISLETNEYDGDGMVLISNTQYAVSGWWPARTICLITALKQTQASNQLLPHFCGNIDVPTSKKGITPNVFAVPVMINGVAKSPMRSLAFMLPLDTNGGALLRYKYGLETIELLCMGFGTHSVSMGNSGAQNSLHMAIRHE